jgi:hypothetical protein
MTEALGDWELELLKPKEERKNARLFAEEHKIPFTTFQSHITFHFSRLAQAMTTNVFS